MIPFVQIFFLFLLNPSRLCLFGFLAYRNQLAIRHRPRSIMRSNGRQRDNSFVYHSALQLRERREVHLSTFSRIYRRAQYFVAFNLNICFIFICKLWISHFISSVHTFRPTFVELLVLSFFFFFCPSASLFLLFFILFVYKREWVHISELVWESDVTPRGAGAKLSCVSCVYRCLYFFTYHRL